jgi:hypothetical protein
VALFESDRGEMIAKACFAIIIGDGVLLAMTKIRIKDSSENGFAIFK